jgi:hypothetical protein
MSEPFFAMRNIHGSDAGEPPIIRNDVPGKYYGYYVILYGEQWIFIYDHETK